MQSPSEEPDIDSFVDSVLDEQIQDAGATSGDVPPDAALELSDTTEPEMAPIPDDLTDNELREELLNRVGIYTTALFEGHDAKSTLKAAGLWKAVRQDVRETTPKGLESPTGMLLPFGNEKVGGVMKALVGPNGQIETRPRYGIVAEVYYCLPEDAETLFGYLNDLIHLSVQMIEAGEELTGGEEAPEAK
jgi:hypothetical protein